MPTPDPTYISLADAAVELGMPEKWLRQEAKAGRLPYLLVGQNRIFLAIADSRRILRDRAEARCVAGVPAQGADGSEAIA